MRDELLWVYEGANAVLRRDIGGAQRILEAGRVARISGSDFLRR